MSVFKIIMLAGLAMSLGTTLAMGQTSPADSTRIRLHQQSEADEYYKAPASKDDSPYYQQDRPMQRGLKRVGVGLTLGLSAPYGNGIEVSYLQSEKLDINGGVGLNLSGFKAGAGVRYFTRGEKGFSPFIGGSLVRSGGVSELAFTNANGQESKYKMHPSTLAHFRGGVRFKYKSIAWLGTTGYGLNLAGKDHELLSGPVSQDAYTMLNFMKAGGLELSGTLQISF